MKKHVLVLNGSLKTINSNTSKLINSFIKRVQELRPNEFEFEVIELVNHEFGQIWPVNTNGTFDNQAAVTKAMQADLLIFGSPMYNYSLSAILKNFIDHIAIPRVSFQYKYTTKKVEGLLKKPYLNLISRGGFYQDLELAEQQQIPLMKPQDEPVIDYIMQDYLGCSKVGSVVIEGMNIKNAEGQAINSIEKQFERQQKAIDSLIKQL